MFFDDRLATVLRQRASSDVGLRTQFRQLLDILGAEKVSTKSARDPGLVAAAWMRMDALGEKIPAPARAAMIREGGWRFHNPALAAHLADQEPDVASAALNRAQLSGDDWEALIPRLPVRARGFLRLRRDLPVDVEKLLERLGVHDRGLPRPIADGPEPDTLPDTFPDALPDALPASLGASLEDADFVGPPPINLGLIDEDVLPDGVGDDYLIDDDPLELAESDAIAIDSDAVPPFDIAPPVPPPFAPEREPETQPANTPETTEADRINEERDEISALVERIAQFKRTRETAPALDSTQPRLPLGEENLRKSATIAAFGFAADAGGRIEWADGKVAAMVIGTRLVAPPRLGSADRQTQLERAFLRRQPIVSARRELFGAKAISGEWVVDAQPRFTDGGNFAGYVGRFRRLGNANAPMQSAAQREADHIRQLLHELRTPVTAVQGYAEVIQQQLFGTAPHEYRALAAAIAADAARILAGFEELDLLAKLETGAITIEKGKSDLQLLALQTTRQLDQVLRPRLAGIVLDETSQDTLIAVDADQTEAMLWRLLATLGGGCATGETIAASIETHEASAVLSCDLPAQLLAEDDVFAAEVKPVGGAINAGIFGAGFALRLARAEARAAGGEMLHEDDRIILSLPLAQSGSDDVTGEDTHYDG